MATAGGSFFPDRKQAPRVLLWLCAHPHQGLPSRALCPGQGQCAACPPGSTQPLLIATLRPCDSLTPSICFPACRPLGSSLSQFLVPVARGWLSGGNVRNVSTLPFLSLRRLGNSRKESQKGYELGAVGAEQRDTAFDCSDTGRFCCGIRSQRSSGF